MTKIAAIVLIIAVLLGGCAAEAVPPSEAIPIHAPEARAIA